MSINLNARKRGSWKKWACVEEDNAEHKARARRNENKKRKYIHYCIDQLPTHIFVTHCMSLTPT